MNINGKPEPRNQDVARLDKMPIDPHTALWIEWFEAFAVKCADGTQDMSAFDSKHPL